MVSAEDAEETTPFAERYSKTQWNNHMTQATGLFDRVPTVYRNVVLLEIFRTC